MSIRPSFVQTKFFRGNVQNEAYCKYLTINYSMFELMFKVLVDGCVHDVHWSTSGLPVKAKALCVRLHHLLPNPGGIPLGCDYLPPGTKQTKERNLRGKPHFAHRRTHLGMRQCLWPGKKNYLSSLSIGTNETGLLRWQFQPLELWCPLILLLKGKVFR